MKLLLSLLLLVCAYAHAQNYAVINDEEKAAQLMAKIRSGHAAAADSNELRQIAYSIQNRGQRIDEEQRQYKRSLASIDTALRLFAALQDTLDIANNRKYKGYLLGKLGKFKEAKTEILAAVDLYGSKGNKAGRAVCQFDLARVFESQDKTDSAIYYANISRDYWKLQGNDLRVLITNNMLVNILLGTNQPEKAALIYQESMALAPKPAIHWQALLDFYFTAELLFRRTNDMGTADHYRQLYAGKIAALQQQGIAARSYYEMAQ